MDTVIGYQTGLSEKFQASAIETLKTDVILGFCYWNESGKIVVTTTRELTEGEKANLLNAIKALEVDARESACRAFNTDLAIAGMNSAFTVQERIALMPYLSGVKEYLNYPSPLRNFADLKLLLLGLVSSEIATQAQYDKIEAVLLEQSINLEDF